MGGSFCSTVVAAWEDKIPLFTVCFQSILLLPSEQDLDISLYSKTLRAVDKMLHMLVFVYPTARIGEELHSIFQCFVKHFYSSETTNLILVALQGMKDCSNYNTQVTANLMAVLTVDFKSTPTDVSSCLLGD
ncbi:hypothetical protein ASZ78_012555 [Callipepla squamata]|uniref:Uncharacterized protein n=1 Tax=Callipepla squamata TaxID=9009 RepID=A0A226MDI2_CALSU|nr:hypothetical protein ASZ78_012555 [Callipepla squamata]